MCGKDSIPLYFYFKVFLKKLFPKFFIIVNIVKWGKQNRKEKNVFKVRNIELFCLNEGFVKN